MTTIPTPPTRLQKGNNNDTLLPTLPSPLPTPTPQYPAMEAKAEDEDSRENDTNESESVDPDWDEMVTTLTENYSTKSIFSAKSPGLSRAVFGAWARPEIFLSLSRLKPGPRWGFWAEPGPNNTNPQQQTLSILPDALQKIKS